MAVKYSLAFVSLLLLLFLSTGVHAQSKPVVYVFEHIADSRFMSSEPPAGSGVKLVNIDRNPQVTDILDAMKKKKKVTVVFQARNASGAPYAHAVRVVAINLTSYNGTNVDNQTVLFHDSEIFDPLTNATYNLTFSYINEHNDTAFLQWGSQWVQLRELRSIYKINIPKPISKLFKIASFKPFIGLINSKDFLISTEPFKKVNF